MEPAPIKVGDDVKAAFEVRYDDTLDFKFYEGGRGAMFHCGAVSNFRWRWSTYYADIVVDANTVVLGLDTVKLDKMVRDAYLAWLASRVME